MKCKKCGAEVKGRFCTVCGEPAEELQECPYCGEKTDSGSRYCGACGKDLYGGEPAGNGGAAAAVKKRAPAKKPLIIGGAVLALAVIISIIVVAVNCSANIFRIGKVDKIDVGDGKERVIEILGEPFDDNGGARFEYYDDKYKELLEKSEGSLEDGFGDIDSEEDFEDAMGDLEDAFTVLQTTEYKYIAVTFDADGKVSEVFFDACRTEMNKDMPKLCKKYEIINDSVMRYAAADIYYSAEFEDGSFYKGVAAYGFVADKEGASSAYVDWEDRWGNKYGESVKVENNPDILLAGELGENIRYSISKEGVVTISGGGEIEGGSYGPAVRIPGELADKTNVAVYLAADVTNFNPENFYFRDESGISPVSLSIRSVSVAEDNPAYIVKDGCIFDRETGTRLIMGSSAGIVPEYVKEIGAHAFRGDELTAVTWKAESCESVSDAAFYSDNISSLTIAEGVRFLPAWFLSGGERDKITEVILPESLTEIDAYTFSGIGMTSITVPEGVAKIGVSAFSGCEQLQKVVWNAVNCEVDNDYGSRYLFGGCDALNKIEIGPDVEYLSNYIFGVITADVYVENLMQCFDLESFGDSMPGSWNLYAGGELVTDLVVPASVTAVDGHAFMGCDSIESVAFAGDNVEIGIWSFEGCSSLVSVDFSGVRVITSAFSNTGLKEVVIPENVVSIDTSAFWFCESLEKVIFEDPNNWVTADYQGETGGSIDVKDIDLTDPAENARKFRERDFNTRNWLNKKDA